MVDSSTLFSCVIFDGTTKLLTYSDFNTSIPIDTFKFGNQFVNPRTAEIASDRTKVNNLLLNYANLLNEDWVPDLSDSQKASYYIYINTDHNLCCKVGRGYYNTFGQVYFKTKEIAEQIIKLIGEDLIIKAWTQT